VTEALDKALAHRVDGTPHDDGDRRGCLLERGQRRPCGAQGAPPRAVTQLSHMSSYLGMGFLPRVRQASPAGGPRSHNAHLSADAPGHLRPVAAVSVSVTPGFPRIARWTMASSSGGGAVLGGASTGL
jgi:hypothetical protein